MVRTQSSNHVLVSEVQENKDVSKYVKCSNVGKLRNSNYSHNRATLISPRSVPIIRTIETDYLNAMDCSRGRRGAPDSLDIYLAAMSPRADRPKRPIRFGPEELGYELPLDLCAGGVTHPGRVRRRISAW